LSQFKKFISEIHRRSIWQVLAVYLIGAWLAFEIIQTLTEGLGLPGWFPALALILFIVGLPIVLATAIVQQGGPSPGTSDPTLIPVEPGDAAKADAGRQGLLRTVTWRNALQAGVIAFALWGVVAMGWLLLRPSGDGRPTSGEVSATAVAVLPFTFRGDEDLSYLGEGMVDLLSRALDGAGELRAVDPWALLSLIEQSGGSRLDPQIARSVAEQFGAGLFVLGNVLETGGQLRIDAVLYDANGNQLSSVEATATDESGVLELVDDLARELVVAGGAGDVRLTRTAAATTSAVDALKAYLEGEQRFRAGRYAEAVDAFQRAVSVDSSFALAYYRMSVAAEWIGMFDVILHASEQAVRYGERLPPRDRQLLEASLALRRGAAGEAELLYEGVLFSYPEDVEAWYQLAESQFHYGPVRGRSISESRRAFERVIELDPENVMAIFHLARVAAREREYPRLDSLVNRAVELQPESGRILELLALRAFVMGDAEERQGVLAQARDAPLVFMISVVGSGVYSEEIDASIQLGRQLTLPGRGQVERILGRGSVTIGQAGFGRLAAARAEAASSSVPDQVGEPTFSAVVTALSAAHPFYPVSEQALEAARAELLSWNTEIWPGDAESVLYGRADQAEVTRLYLLGLISARMGQGAAARDYATELEGQGPLAEWGSMVSDLAHTVRALAARSEGRLEDSLAEIEQARYETHYAWLTTSPLHAQSAGRFLRAELLEVAGRDEEALRWYRASTELSFFDVINLAPAHLRRAEIYERLGDEQNAVHHYARFIKLWQDADPELQPMVEEARHALERLTDEPMRN
jgi:serine/threonine-protein kinase